MPASLSAARPRLCSFTFDDGRHCKIPHRPDHHLCQFHARRDAAARASRDAAWNIAYDLSGSYIAFRDVSAAIAHAISAVAYGHLKGRSAATVAYLCQSLVQSTLHAEHEHIRAFGFNDWQDELVKSFNSRRPTPDVHPQAPPDFHPDSRAASCPPDPTLEAQDREANDNEALEDQPEDQFDELATTPHEEGTEEPQPLIQENSSEGDEGESDEEGREEVEDRDEEQELTADEDELEVSANAPRAVH